MDICFVCASVINPFLGGGFNKEADYSVYDINKTINIYDMLRSIYLLIRMCLNILNKVYRSFFLFFLWRCKQDVCVP